MSLVVGGIFTLLGGGSALLSWYYNRKQNRRLLEAEAAVAEYARTASEITSLRAQMVFYEERLAALQKMVESKDGYIQVLSHDKDVLEIKHAKNKSVINKAHECEICDDLTKCPVLRQRKINDDAYAAQLESKSKGT